MDTNTVASTASMFIISLHCRDLSIGLASGPCLFSGHSWALLTAAWLFSSVIFSLIFLEVVTRAHASKPVPWAVPVHLHGSALSKS